MYPDVENLWIFRFDCRIQALTALTVVAILPASTTIFAHSCLCDSSPYLYFLL
jgi:hypothetical protein